MSLSMSKYSQLDTLNDQIAIFMTLTKKYIVKHPYYLYNIYIVKQKNKQNSKRHYKSVT